MRKALARRVSPCARCSCAIVSPKNIPAQHWTDTTPVDSVHTINGCPYWISTLRIDESRVCRARMVRVIVAGAVEERLPLDGEERHELQRDGIGAEGPGQTELVTERLP